MPVLAFCLNLGEIREAGQVRQNLSAKGALCLSLYRAGNLGFQIRECNENA